MFPAIPSTRGKGAIQANCKLVRPVGLVSQDCKCYRRGYRGPRRRRRLAANDLSLVMLKPAKSESQMKLKFGSSTLMLVICRKLGVLIMIDCIAPTFLLCVILTSFSLGHSMRWPVSPTSRSTKCYLLHGSSWPLGLAEIAESYYPGEAPRPSHRHDRITQSGH